MRARDPSGALVVVLHGAGPRLTGLVEQAARLAPMLGEGTTILHVDAARPVGVVQRTLRLFGERPFGYDAETLARSDYDRRVPQRVCEAIAAHRTRWGDEACVVLVGHSLGAAMAVEVVERLAARGVRLDEVLLLDRMFFEWRWGAFLGLWPRIVHLTPRGAAAIDRLQEILVHPSSLPWLERIWVSFPAGGHVPLEPAVASRAGDYRRAWAPREYGHGAVVWWPEPWGRIATARAAAGRLGA